MKTLLFPIVLLIVTIISGCQDSGEPNTDDFQNYTGIVIKQSAVSFLIESDKPIQDNVKTFYPEKLADLFKRDSLKVRFSGKITTPPDPMYQYPIVKLSSIEVIEH
jgi:hypothetical protein